MTVAQEIPTEGTWSYEQAAEYLGCTPGTLRVWTSRRRVAHHKCGKLTRFRRRDLDDFLEQNRVEAER